MCMVKSTRYYSLSVLNCNQIHHADLCSQQLKSVHKNLRKPHTFVVWKNVVLLSDNIRSNSTRITQEKILNFDSFCSTPFTIFARPSSDFYRYKMLWMIRNFLNRWKRFCKTSCMETSWILLERDQRANWLMARGDSKLIQCSIIDQ